MNLLEFKQANIMKLLQLLILGLKEIKNIKKKKQTIKKKKKIELMESTGQIDLIVFGKKE